MTVLRRRTSEVPDAVEAFADWVRPHLPAMTRLAARLAPESDRDDVVQEALPRARSEDLLVEHRLGPGGQSRA